VGVESRIVLDGLYDVPKDLLHRGNPALDAPQVVAIRICIGVCGWWKLLNIISGGIDPPQIATPWPKR
jgi:hypothetical protein